MESPGATRPADDGKASHIFTELRSHDDLLLPVRGSKRLKYTCITCSRQYIALGSSHGGLYIFQRDTLKYLQQIGNKEGLTKALFSPDENVVGMATSGGAIIVWKLNVTSRQKAERLVATQAHRHQQITSLCWDGAGLRLFSGDERGRITVTNTDSSKPSGIFKFQSELVVDVDSKVVQMDFADERLLISTMTRCYLCDPKKQLCFPIGTKPRDGAYGACFLKKTGSEKPSIFCARPGSRMWEANTLCQVLNTHQFKQLLATPPLPVMGKGREVIFAAEDTKHPAQSLAFPVLHPLGSYFLVTWNERGVYVFDPVNVKVVFWTNGISGLVDVSVSKSSLYCLHQDSHIRKYTLQAIARCASSLYQQSLLIQCSRLVLRYQTLFQRSRARHHMPSRVLHELAKRVAAEDSILGCEVEELAVSVENALMDVVSAVSSRRSSFDSYDGMRMQSGIYVVRKRLDSECSDELPLGYDAHMDQMQASMDKSRQETIQESSLITGDIDSKEATPTEDIKLKDGEKFLVAAPKDENSIGEITESENGSKDCDRKDGAMDEQNLTLEDTILGHMVNEEEDSPGGGNLTEQHKEQITSEGYVFEEYVSEHVAESCEVTQEENNSSRDEVDATEGIKDVTDNARNAQEFIGSSSSGLIEPVLRIEGSDVVGAEPDLSISFRDGNNEDNTTCVEDVLPLEEKALQHQNTNSVVSFEAPEERTDTETSLHNVQVLEVRGSETGVKDIAANIENQRMTTGTYVDNADITKEIVSGEDITKDLCLSLNTEIEPNNELLIDESSFNQKTEEETICTHHNDIIIKEEELEVSTRSVNLLTDNEERTPLETDVSGFGLDVSGFGLDVSGFGISPSEKSFHMPIQGEEATSFDKSLSPIEVGVAPSKEGDFTGLDVNVDQSASPKDSDHSSAINHLENQTKEDERMMTFTAGKEDGDLRKQEFSQELASEDSAAKAVDQSNTNLPGSGYNNNQAAVINEESCSIVPTPCPVSNITTMNDSIHSFSSLDKSKESSIESISSSISDDSRWNQSQLSDQIISSASASSENLEIVLEDDLEVAEEDAQFPDAEMELVQTVTGSQYIQKESDRKRDCSLNPEKINEESSRKGSTPSTSGKRKKTKSRVIDITATVSSKPSPLQAMAPGSVLYRPTSLPDLSTQSSSSQARPPQRTPSSTTPSPAMSPKKEMRRPSPVSPALSSPNLVIAATSGLPHASGLMETQQIILGSTPQINLKSVKDSLTSKLSKTKTFLQSMGDSNPLSPKEGEQRLPPIQPRPSPSSGPISGSPTHRKGVSPSVANNGVTRQNSTGRPYPSPVTSPSHQPHPPGDFPHVQVEEGTEEEQMDFRLSQDLIDATKAAVPALRDPQTRYNTVALRNALQPWVSTLEQTYRSCQAEAIVPWSSGQHLPRSVRDDVGRLATLCISLDIYANEKGEPGSEFEQEGKEYKLDESRAAFIKRHFIILDRRRVMEILQRKPGCHHSAMESILQCEWDAARNSSISEALTNGDTQAAFDLLLRANLSSSNLTLSLCFLQRLSGLDSGRAIDIMVTDYPTVGPWHAYHILQDNSNSNRLIMDYVESFLVTHHFSQRKKFIQEVMAMKPLVISLAKGAVTSDPPSMSDLFCECGELPSLGSHLIKWSHDQILDLLLTSTCAPVDVLLPLFLRVGHWHGAVDLMAHEEGHKMVALKICIQLGDVALIKNDFIPSSEEEWRTVLEWMKKYQPSAYRKDNSSERNCLHCGTSLSPCSTQRSLTTEAMGEVSINVIKQEKAGVEERLSPSSQPECDWSIMEQSEQKDQSGSSVEKDEHLAGVDRADGFDGDRRNSETGNSQSDDTLETLLSRNNVTGQSKEGNEQLRSTEQNRQEEPNISSSAASSKDSDWLPTVTWQRIALLLVSRLGVVQGIKLLREIQVPEGLLSREFHNMCIYASVWEKRQTLLSHAMLEGTDTYLWSKRQPLLGPALQHTIMKEYQGVKQGRTDICSEGERVLKAQNLLSQKQLYIEDPGTHWGRTINLGRTCSVCNKAVAWSSSLQSSGCMLFPCGHTFHTRCLPEKACILCFYGNQKM